MLQTIWLIMSLRITCTVNAIQYYVRRIPIIKRLFAGKSYDASELKLSFSILAVIWEIIKAFVGKIIYLIAIIFLVTWEMDVAEFLGYKADFGNTFLHVLIIFTIIGAMLNNHLFCTGDDEYSAVIMLRMNAKRYAIISYSYFLIKMFVGLSVVMSIIGIFINISLWVCILFAAYVIGSKLIATAIEIVGYEKNKDYSLDGLKGYGILAILALLVFALVPPLFGYELAFNISVVVMIVIGLCGAISINKIKNYNNYELTYKRELFNYKNNLNDAASSVEEKNSRSALKSDKLVDIKSDKHGLEMLNELFIKRHKKLLWQMTKRIVIVEVLLFVGISVLTVLSVNFREGIHNEIMKILPALVFVMYALNRGLNFTQALYVNCDHGMLTYSFFKEPRLILKLFRLRLKELVKINIVPAVILGVGLAFVYFISGGTDSIINYFVLIISVVSLSIFFSVHFMTIYYLLQPYNSQTQLKSAGYFIVRNITYVIAYALVFVETSSVMFGLGTIFFCVIYCVIAFLLVYKFAPKTYRIKN